MTLEGGVWCWLVFGVFVWVVMLCWCWVLVSRVGAACQPTQCLLVSLPVTRPVVWNVAPTLHTITQNKLSNTTLQRAHPKTVWWSAIPDPFLCPTIVLLSMAHWCCFNYKYLCSGIGYHHHLLSSALPVQSLSTKNWGPSTPQCFIFSLRI